jgi:hypothetical protein
MLSLILYHAVMYNNGDGGRRGVCGKNETPTQFMQRIIPDLKEAKRPKFSPICAA